MNDAILSGNHNPKMDKVKKPPDLPDLPPDDDMNDTDQNNWVGAASLTVLEQQRQNQRKQYTNVVYTDVDTGPYRVYTLKTDSRARQNKMLILIGISLFC